MKSPPMIELVLVPAAEREPLFQLVDEYLAELMRYRDVPVGPVNARAYKYLPMYWEEAGRHPFLFVAGGERIGFSLVREVAKHRVVQMSDFYIRPNARRLGFGGLAAAEIWRRFPGAWELQVHLLNAAAESFWSNCIAERATGPVRRCDVQEEDGRRVQFNFEIA